MEGMTSLGKQVTTYLRGRVAEGYQEALSEEGKTSYALLNDCVEEYLSARGYMPRKGEFIPQVGPARERYEKEVARKVASILEGNKDVLAGVMAAMQEEEHPKAKVAHRRARRIRGREGQVDDAAE